MIISIQRSESGKKMIDIDKVIRHLKQRRQVFTSEADLQLELAWVIKEMYPEFMVRMEYCPKVNRNIHIDILIITDSGWIPIELKYKTKGCSIDVDDEEFVLKNHGAKDINCYLYLKDIQRIEELNNIVPEFIEGYTIMLTNEPSYLAKPVKPDCVYAEFSLHEGAVKHGKMDWSDNASDGTKKGCEKPIELDRKYEMHWKEYSKLNDNSGGTFYVLVNTIKG